MAKVKTKPVPKRQVVKCDEWDERDISLLQKLYDQQPLACDRLPYTPQMEAIAKTFTSKAVKNRPIGTLFLKLQGLRKQKRLKPKIRGVVDTE